MKHLTLAACVACVILSAACAQPPEAPVRAGALANVRPELVCNHRECGVLVVAEVSGRTIRSQPLPFASEGNAAYPAVLERTELAQGDDAGLGYRVAGDEVRVVEVWVAGSKEQGLLIGIEQVKVVPGRFALLVHQSGGFEHVKRAHTVLAVESDRLTSVEQFVEGPGPDVISVAPQAGGVVVVRHAGVGSPPRTSAYRWLADAARLTLVLNVEG